MFIRYTAVAVRFRLRHHRLLMRYIVFSSARVFPAKIQTDPAPFCRDRILIPAVPPGLMLSRPLCVCCHIPARFTKSHSVSHTLPEAFPFALESPFNRSAPAAIPPSATLFAKPVPIYFSFSSVFLNLSQFPAVVNRFITVRPRCRRSAAPSFPTQGRRL